MTLGVATARPRPVDTVASLFFAVRRVDNFLFRAGLTLCCSRLGGVVPEAEPPGS